MVLYPVLQYQSLPEIYAFIGAITFSQPVFWKELLYWVLYPVLQYQVEPNVYAFTGTETALF